MFKYKRKKDNSVKVISSNGNPKLFDRNGKRIYRKETVEEELERRSEEDVGDYEDISD